MSKTFQKQLAEDVAGMLNNLAVVSVVAEREKFPDDYMDQRVGEYNGELEDEFEEQLNKFLDKVRSVAVLARKTEASRLAKQKPTVTWK